MLNYFMCWTRSDPIYQNYFPESNILISLPHLPRSFTLKQFKIMPRKLMIDSGAYYLMTNPHYQMNQADIFKRQLEIASCSNVPTVLCHLDYPIPYSVTDKIEIHRRLEKTIANAYEFINLFKNEKLPFNFKSLGVIQGNDYESINFCAREMKRIGFDIYGLGSFIGIYQTDIILERVRSAIEVIGANIHIFGVSAMETVKSLLNYGIKSFDSSRAMKLAMYLCVAFSNPFRVYKIKDSKSDKTMPILESPIPCDCPICLCDPMSIFKVGEKRYTNSRAIHNYYHITKELEQIYSSNLFPSFFN